MELLGSTSFQLLDVTRLKEARSIVRKPTICRSFKLGTSECFQLGNRLVENLLVGLLQSTVVGDVFPFGAPSIDFHRDLLQHIIRVLFLDALCLKEALSENL